MMGIQVIPNEYPMRICQCDWIVFDIGADIITKITEHNCCGTSILYAPDPTTWIVDTAKHARGDAGVAWFNAK